MHLTSLHSTCQLTAFKVLLSFSAILKTKTKSKDRLKETDEVEKRALKVKDENYEKKRESVARVRWPGLLLIRHGSRYTLGT